jgi:hypothetical protein
MGVGMPAGHATLAANRRPVRYDLLQGCFLPLTHACLGFHSWIMLHAGQRIGIGMFGNVANTTVSLSNPVCTSASYTGQRIIMSDIASHRR